MCQHGCQKLRTVEANLTIHVLVLLVYQTKVWWLSLEFIVKHSLSTRFSNTMSLFKINYFPLLAQFIETGKFFLYFTFGHTVISRNFARAIIFFKHCFSPVLKWTRSHFKTLKRTQHLYVSFCIT